MNAAAYTAFQMLILLQIYIYMYILAIDLQPQRKTYDYIHVQWNYPWGFPCRLQVLLLVIGQDFCDELATSMHSLHDTSKTIVGKEHRGLAHEVRNHLLAISLQVATGRAPDLIFVIIADTWEYQGVSSTFSCSTTRLPSQVYNGNPCCNKWTHLPHSRSIPVNILECISLQSVALFSLFRTPIIAACLSPPGCQERP